MLAPVLAPMAQATVYVRTSSKQFGGAGGEHVLDEMLVTTNLKTAQENSQRTNFGAKLRSMRFSYWVCTCLLMLGAAPMLGCGSSSNEAAAVWEPAATNGPRTIVAFEQVGSLALGLREERTLSVVVDPPEPHQLNFVLLGDSLDATLDHAAVATDEHGRASVKLRAPNQSTTFTVRTWIMRGPSDELTVSTVGDGFAPVEIVPIYKGSRPITDWTANIVPRSTCADISPLLPADVVGSLPGHAPFGDPLIVPGAPVGPSLAVTVRAGNFAWGCSDAFDLVVGETMKVKVNVIDKPIVVGATNLDVTFSLKPDPVDYAQLLQSTSMMMIDAFVPKEIDPGTSLLDAMAARVPESMQMAFADARLLGGWDVLTSTHLAMQPVSFSDALGTWFTTGLATEPSEFVATLEAIAEVPGAATLSPLRFGSVSASDAGMPGKHLASLSLDAGDVMHLGGSLYWLPSRYLGALLAHKALLNTPEGTTMPDVLSALAGCDVLGQTLVGFDTCDATCMTGLCHEVLATRWENANDASASSGNIGLINIASVVTTSVDDKAAPVSFQGSWLGSITDGVQVAKISKAEISAEQHPAPPPAPPPP